MERKKISQAAKNRELRKLSNKCLSLWKIAIKAGAGNECERCGTDRMVNSHHVESYLLNKALRYDLRNGLALCPLHHKFGKDSVHKSFVFTYELMTENHPNALAYLINHRNDKIKLTKGFLLNKIKELNLFLLRRDYNA